MAIKFLDTAPSTGSKIRFTGPAPQQLRAGTGSFMGDIKQDAANIFLPERFAAEIAQKQNPGSEIYQDDDGNWILRRKDGSEHYLNAPGLGVQDALNVTGALAIPGIASWGAAKIAPGLAAGAKSAAIANPVLSGMGAGAAYSAAEQGVGASLTDQDVSLTEIGAGGVWGGVAPLGQKYGGLGLDALARTTGVEAFRNPIKSAGYALERATGVTGSELLNNPIKSALRGIKNIRSGTGELTKTAKEALDAAGIKWQSFTPDQIEMANSKTADVLGMNPQAQGRGIGMATMGIDDPTKAMLSQRPDDVFFEAMGFNRRGREAAAHQLQAAGRGLGRPDNLESVGNRLLDLHATDQRAVKDSFDAARRAGEVDPVPTSRVASLRDNMIARMKDDLSRDQIDAAMAGFPKLPEVKTQSILGPDGKPISTFDMPGEEAIDPQTVRSLFEWRRDHLGALSGGEAKLSKEAFDAEMKQWLEDGLATGLSADGIRAYKAANDLMREYSIKWDSGDVIDRIVTQNKQGSGQKQDMESVANMLWNSSEAGFINKPTLRGDIQKLKERLGPDSPEFKALGDALTYKALKLRKGFTEGQRAGSLKVGGTAMANHWNLVKEESGDILKDLYDPKTLDAFDNFITYARAMDTQLGKEAKVPLEQASQAMVHIFKRLGSATFRFSRAAFNEAADRAKAGGTNSALSEFYGDLYTPRGINTPRVAAAAAVEAAWIDEYNDILREFGIDLPGGPEPLQIDILNGVPQP